MFTFNLYKNVFQKYKQTIPGKSEISALPILCRRIYEKAPLSITARPQI